MNAAPIVGTIPYLPGALGRWDAIVGTMPASRLVALRIAAGVVLLFDMFVTVWPYSEFLLSSHSVVAADPFAGHFQWPHLNWSISRLMPHGQYVTALLATVAALGLISGRFIRASALLAWVGTVSMFRDNTFAVNGGDQLRTTLFLILAVAPPVRWGETISVPRWPATVLLLQLAVCYFLNGAFKSMSPAWRDGSVMRQVITDETWCLVPGLAAQLPDFALRIGAWATLVWELMFPIMVCSARTRTAALAIGALFHIGTFLTLVVGMFPFYALCLYVPFVPWERFTRLSRS